MIPDEKFLRINGKNMRTGTIETMIAAKETVLDEIRNIISGGIPSVIVDV